MTILRQVGEGSVTAGHRPWSPGSRGNLEVVQTAAGRAQFGQTVRQTIASVPGARDQAVGRDRLQHGQAGGGEHRILFMGDVADRDVAEPVEVGAGDDRRERQDRPAARLAQNGHIRAPVETGVAPLARSRS